MFVTLFFATLAHCTTPATEFNEELQDMSQVVNSTFTGTKDIEPKVSNEEFEGIIKSLKSTNPESDFGLTTPLKEEEIEDIIKGFKPTDPESDFGLTTPLKEEEIEDIIKGFKPTDPESDFGLTTDLKSGDPFTLSSESSSTNNTQSILKKRSRSPLHARKRQKITFEEDNRDPEEKQQAPLEKIKILKQVIKEEKERAKNAKHLAQLFAKITPKKFHAYPPALIPKANLD